MNTNKRANVLVFTDAIADVTSNCYNGKSVDVIKGGSLSCVVTVFSCVLYVC